jgi:hypothetical protein
LLCTQLKFPSKQTRFGLKTPPDPHMDRIAQSLREPWERGLQHVTVPSFPRLRPCMEPPARIPQPLVEPREGSEQPQRGWKPPALDCGSHLHPTTPAHRPGIVTPLLSRSMADTEGVLSSLPPSSIRKFGRRA